MQPMPMPELKHALWQAQKGAQLIEPENWKVQCFEQRNLESLGTYKENARIKFIYKKCRWVELRQDSFVGLGGCEDQQPSKNIASK